ncbi:hypothetical protein [Rhizobium chutanense]|uniref:hypothetical protein n=1 Tax=Rhizobium chutanense TaxID=2035448 RepID=UPI0015CF1D05|nr:hypothetical protein [Rhizobium chutanense]
MIDFSYVHEEKTDRRGSGSCDLADFITVALQDDHAAGLRRVWDKSGDAVRRLI